MPSHPNVHWRAGLRRVQHLNDGSAEKAFQEDLETTRRYGVRGFPTFLLRHAGKELMLRGHQNFSTMQAVIETLTGGRVQARAPESGPEDVFAFLQRYGRAAPIEVATVFGLSPGESETILDGLASERRIHRVVAGNGYFWESASPGGSCEEGVCTPNQ